MALQAIQTKYIGPTNTKPARISVSAQAGRKIYAWDHALNTPQNHVAAARQFCIDKAWGLDELRLVSGASPSGEHVYFHCLEERGQS